jgi:serine/threonine protein kinase
MKMEARDLIHADLSPGNVVLNDGFHGSNRNSESVADGDGEDEAGDMALVDFDRYVHLPGDLPEPGQGSPGYAAPEIWQKQIPSVGSDRTALAILIQEFLVVGDPDISRQESLSWAYDQEARCFEWTFAAEGEPPVDGENDHWDAHPLLARKYPALAKMVRSTLAASAPMARSSPEDWRRALLDIVEPAASQSDEKLRSLLIEADPVPTPALRLAFGASRDSLDLSTSGFGIHASLERDSSRSIFVAVHNEATINIKMPGSRAWTRYPSGGRVRAEIGMVLSDNNGKSNARFARSR